MSARPGPVGPRCTPAGRRHTVGNGSESETDLATAGPRPYPPRSRRRFVLAASTGMAVVTLPYLWVLFVLWNGTPNLLRNVYANGYGGDFYDLQARSMLSGHLDVPAGRLSIESWVHHGHNYTYFGLFPSLLRMPVLLVTHRVDGHLTALSLLAAWLVTGVFTSLLVWRVRIIIRGDAVLGRAEAAVMGVLVASVAGGSVLVYLAANPYVYSEDKAWSVALAVGAFLALLGMLERPTWGRVASCTLLIVAANLTRATEGYACVVGAVLVSLWFALGKRGPERRRWWKPMVGVAILAVVVGSVVDYAKFGVLFGLPLNDYTAFHVLNEKHINGGRYFDPLYLPSTLVAYLQPGGLRLTGVFPYITLPAGPTRVVGNVLFDNRTRTASVTASMPLLFLLSCLGVLSACRRHAGPAMSMLRIVLIASATGTAAVLFYGWIADRYLADFLPFLVIASAMGSVTLWRRLEGRSRRIRLGACGLMVALGAFGIAANLALSVTPTDAWSTAQTSRFLRTQNALSNLTGHPLHGQILQGNSLPFWAPAGTVYIAGHCNALYVSDGEDYRGVLNQRAEHRTWVDVEHGQGYQHGLTITFGPADVASGSGVSLASMGQSTLLIHSTTATPGWNSVWFTVQDPHYASTSVHATIRQGSTHPVVIQTDRYRRLLTVMMDGNTYVQGPVTAQTLPLVRIDAPQVSRAFAVSEVLSKAPGTPLCHQLAAGT